MDSTSQPSPLLPQMRRVKKLATVFLGQTTQEEAEKHFAMQGGRATVFALRDYVFFPGSIRIRKIFWEKPEPEEGSVETTPASEYGEEADVQEEVLE